MGKKWGIYRRYSNKINVVELPNNKQKFACSLCGHEWKYKDNAIKCYLRCLEEKEDEEIKKLKRLFK